MRYFALIYHVVEDYMVRRAQYRDQHLQLAREAQREGNLILGGAFADPSDMALLIFRAADASVPEGFAKRDPYVVNGLVARWEVRSWTVVIGNEPQTGS